MLLAAALSLSFTSCSGKNNPSPSTSDTATSSVENSGTEEQIIPDEMSEESSIKEEGASAHISPMETISSNIGCKFDVNTIVPRTEGSNTIEIPLAHFINEGDKVKSFTFIIYGADGNINDFKGGFGISQLEGSPVATTDYWYQTDAMIFPTQGGYGEIRWDISPELAEYINPNGKVQFGYYWGSCNNIRLDSIFCEYTRTRNVPVDGTETIEVGQTVNFQSDTLGFEIPLDNLPKDTVPEVITADLSAEGPINMFQGKFAYESAIGTAQGDPIGMFTDENNLQLTWFWSEDDKQYYRQNGKVFLYYWWGGQENVTMNSLTVKYSNKDTSSVQEIVNNSVASAPDDTGFRSANEIVEAMNIGWNLGNAFDCYKTGLEGLDTETGWGNPKTTKDMIRSVKSAGFNTIRIPVTWGEHMDENSIIQPDGKEKKEYNIQPEWLDRIQEVVNYAYGEGLFVIINVHHDDYIWLTPDSSQYQADSDKLKAIWSQLSERFKEYGDRLIFEGMNEPRTIGSAMEWMGGTLEERSVVNNYEADFVKTVRASGGNNAARTLIVTSYAASAETIALKDTIVPKSGNIIFSVHYYAPWKFSEGHDTEFTEKGREELDKKFSELKEKFIDRGIPVIIDEFGCVNAAPEEVRAQYFKYYVAAAKKLGIKCVVWDNGLLTGDGSFGIFSRNNCSWNSTLLKALMDGANS